MNSQNGEFGNPYILKREGKFNEALQSYAYEFVSAHNESNEYIAQMCFDQMLDAQLLEFLKKRQRFETMKDLKRQAQARLNKVVRENFDGRFAEYFDSSWKKFDRRKDATPLMSVHRDLLIEQQD